MKILMVLLSCVAVGLTQPTNVEEFVTFLDRMRDSTEMLQFESTMRRLVPMTRHILGFSWSNCGSAGDALQIKSLTIQPNPIKIPGTVTLAGSATLSTDLTSNIAVSLKIEKKVAFIWVEIPCIDQIGSCSYADICPLDPLKTCPPVLVQNKIPCHCPFPKGSYTLPSSNFPIDPKQKIPSWLTSGDYKVTVHASIPGKSVACVNAAFSLN